MKIKALLNLPYRFVTILLRFVCPKLRRNCSRMTNIKTVCGRILTKEGMNPLVKVINPSSFNIICPSCIIFIFPGNSISRVFVTSIGCVIAVAVIPYKNWILTLDNVV